MLISVHIPKTGGASFGGILKNHFGNRLLLDYEDRPFNRRSIPRNFCALTKSISITQNTARNYDCIHGHFLPIKYWRVSLRTHHQFAIWLRDPVERVLSRYYHWHRNQRNGPDKSHRAFLTQSDMSLETFCNISHYQNLYAKYLWGFNLNRFNFIGITEKYSESLDLFCKLMGLNTPNEVPSTHKNTEKDLGANYAIDEDIKQKIRQSNRLDCALYEKCVKINQTLIEQYS